LTNSPEPRDQKAKTGTDLDREGEPALAGAAHLARRPGQVVSRPIPGEGAAASERKEHKVIKGVWKKIMSPLHG